VLYRASAVFTQAAVPIRGFGSGFSNTGLWCCSGAPTLDRDRALELLEQLVDALRELRRRNDSYRATRAARPTAEPLRAGSARLGASSRE